MQHWCCPTFFRLGKLLSPWFYTAMVYKKRKSVPLGENLKLMCEDSKLSQEQVGEKVGKTRQQIGYLEKSRNSKEAAYADIAEKAFDCLLEDMASYHKTRFLKKKEDEKEE
jgi:transcriptional regulator with XRE-family HTH domain